MRIVLILFREEKSGWDLFITSFGTEWLQQKQVGRPGPTKHPCTEERGPAALAMTFSSCSLGLSCWAERVVCLWFLSHWSWWGKKLLSDPSILKIVPCPSVMAAVLREVLLLCLQRGDPPPSPRPPASLMGVQLDGLQRNPPF